MIWGKRPAAPPPDPRPRTPSGVIDPSVAEGEWRGVWLGWKANARWDGAGRPMVDNWDQMAVIDGGIPLVPPPAPASHELAVGLVAGPGSGKTSMMATAAMLWGSSAIIVTSKPDLGKLVAGYRSRLGPVRWLDWSGAPVPVPGVIPVRWSILDGMDDQHTVIARVESLLSAVEHGGEREKGMWRVNAGKIAKAYLFAAATAGLGPEQVLDWLSEYDVRTSAEICDKVPGCRFGRDLRGLPVTAQVTLEGMFASASPLFAALSDPFVLESMQNPDLRVADMLRERQTLIIVDPQGESEESPNAPLTVALVARILSEARRLAAAEPGGADHPPERLFPAVALFLDEVANVCPLPLSKLLSTSRELGPVVWAVQSPGQLEARYGRPQSEAIWDHTSARMVGSGIASEQWLGGVSAVLGKFKEWSPSVGSDGKRSHSQSERDVMTVSQLSSIPKGTALLMRQGTWEMVRWPHPASVEPMKTWIKLPVEPAEQREEREAEIRAWNEGVEASRGVIVGESESPPEGSLTVKGTRNPFPYGQCTWRAYHENPIPGVGGDDDAGRWVERAARRVVRVPPDSRPPVGGLVVYRPGAEYGAHGHVAVVTDVFLGPHGGVQGYRVGEANLKLGNPGLTTYRVVTWPDPNVVAFLPPLDEWYSYKPVAAFAEPWGAEEAGNGDEMDEVGGGDDDEVGTPDMFREEAKL